MPCQIQKLYVYSISNMACLGAKGMERHAYFGNSNRKLYVCHLRLRDHWNRSHMSHRAFHVFWGKQWSIDWMCTPQSFINCIATFSDQTLAFDRVSGLEHTTPLFVSMNRRESTLFGNWKHCNTYIYIDIEIYIYIYICHFKIPFLPAQMCAHSFI